jgi:hypothetical protein
MFFLRKGGIRLKILKKTGLYQVKSRKLDAKGQNFLMSQSLEFLKVTCLLETYTRFFCSTPFFTIYYISFA